ncbi:astakine-like [Ornithodoros turicata]|uniref:astakine-like n=1 Tax=Ornithodoros turicata TaxID=34597 RepID=UPI003138AD5C
MVAVQALLRTASFCILVSICRARIPGSCTGPEDCQPDECCLVGMQRYSIPRCEKVGQIGATCRPYNLAEDRTLYYPHGTVIETRSTYTLLCPCDAGLTCSGARCEPRGDSNSVAAESRYDDH